MLSVSMRSMISGSGLNETRGGGGASRISMTFLGKLVGILGGQRKPGQGRQEPKREIGIERSVCSWDTPHRVAG